jgi:hypothetical protein
MKNSISLLIACLAFFVTACSVGNVSKSGGMDNQGYLQFVQGGDTHYGEGVTVYLDNEPAFTAAVDKIKRLRVKGHTYAVKTGTRRLKVVYKGTTLYEKNIIIANQETKQINLP